MTEVVEESKGVTLLECVFSISIVFFIGLFVSLLLSDNDPKHNNSINNSELIVNERQITNQPTSIVKSETFITETTKEINIDFKDSEKIIYPLIASIFGFLFFRKFNKLLLSFNSFLNVIRTKKMLRKINKAKNIELLKLTNLTEIQIMTNKNILNLNQNFVSLATYNDVLVSKHNSLIEMISNNK